MKFSDLDDIKAQFELANKILHFNYLGLRNEDNTKVYLIYFALLELPNEYFRISVSTNNEIDPDIYFYNNIDVIQVTPYEMVRIMLIYLQQDNVLSSDIEKELESIRVSNE